MHLDIQRNAEKEREEIEKLWGGERYWPSSIHLHVEGTCDKRVVLLVYISKTTKTVDLVMTDSWSLMRPEKLNRAVRDYFAEERKVRKIIRPKILTF